MDLVLPELGENIETASVTAVLVKVGQRVRPDQPVIEVETEKATLEVPATGEGVVREVLVKSGDQIRVGSVILRLTPADAAAEGPAEAPQASRAEAPAEPPAPRPAAVEREPGAAPAAAAVADAPPTVIEFPTSRRPPVIGPTVAAAPSVRALARELGIDILRVPGSGAGGRISRDDVKAHAKRLLTGAAAAPPAPTLPDFGVWGTIDSEPLIGVRRATARAMAQAWAQVPHVTQFDHADITELERLRQRARAENPQRKLTMTAIVIHAVAAQLGRFPRCNASLDLAREVVILKRYVHIGVAVDTDRGLLVPVIRDADRKSLPELAVELEELARRARERKLTPDEMQGASFTVSNLGGLGTTYFSPIVPWPQAAILGVGRAEMQPRWLEERFEPRLILPLSVSYDHRLIDGADAARFLRSLAEALERPQRLVEA